MSQTASNDATDILNAAAARIDLARTALFVPATRPERIAKAFDAGADAVIVDLEDAVAPDAKAQARQMLSEVFDAPAEFGLETAVAAEPKQPTGDGTNVIAGVREVAVRKLAVRFSPPASADGRDDLEWLASLLTESAHVSWLDAIMVAKAETVVELDQVAAILDAASATGVSIVPLVESPAGLANAPALAAHPRVSRLALGAIDMAVELGCEPRGATMDYVRAQLVVASALAGMQGPLDTPSAEFKDDDLVRADTEHVKRNGCTGKLCIHPRQVPIVAEVFAPTEEEVDWARRVLAVEDGLGQVDGQMVDRPVILRARRILGV
ncbi:HpcH/HpaI aldolase/citrate lyase family protein [Gulosibacter chungangensis]|uniref:CoA ester lyase n=1 Tax=Gulosibacter chungangensis TaxID=979746 RepID=A0A7J5B9G6_9MICO|nr:CoA ester lyase [Gulosibacter chungangensis]KAB1641206.1 CoA ester lyase [Gulosibacter chungangensis]